MGKIIKNREKVDAVTSAAKPVGKGIYRKMIKITSDLMDIADNNQRYASIFKDVKESFFEKYIQNHIGDCSLRTGGTHFSFGENFQIGDEIGVNIWIKKVSAAGFALMATFVNLDTNCEHALVTEEINFVNQQKELVKIPANLRGLLERIADGEYVDVEPKVEATGNLIIPFQFRDKAVVDVPVEEDEVEAEEKLKIRIKKMLLFPAYFIVARLVRLFSAFFNRKGPVKVAFIACYRDEIDVLRFGHWNIKSTPDVLPWIKYKWEGIKGRLFMIGSITEQLAGDKATETSKENGRRQFIKAVEQAIEAGAEVILLAAGGTKRLFTAEKLKEFFPEVTSVKTERGIVQIPKTMFGIGDNLAGILLGMRIFDAFERSGLYARESRVLIVAPYGFLGRIAFDYLKKAECEIVGMGNPDPGRRDTFEKFAKKKGFKAAHSFEEVGYVDMVVACNSADYAQLDFKRIEKMRKPGHNLIIIDPNEPCAMTQKSFYNCEGNVIRYDAGNGYSPYLKYILGPISYKLLRMDKGISWGCFCETFILAKHPELRERNWFEISSKNMEIMFQFYGEGKGQFSLPKPSCFNKLITDFRIQKSKQG